MSDSLAADSVSDFTQPCTPSINAGQGIGDGCQDDVTGDYHNSTCPPVPPAGDRFFIDNCITNPEVKSCLCLLWRPIYKPSSRSSAAPGRLSVENLAGCKLPFQ